MPKDKMEIIDSYRANIDDAIDEVKRMISANGGVGVSHWSAFILCSCIIDYLAGYRYAIRSEHKGEKYKMFIREYFDRANPSHHYDENDIYYYLRCGMVHGYTDMYKGQTKFLFTHLHDGMHLRVKRFRASDGQEGERMVIRLQEFVNDIEAASLLLYEDAANSPMDDEIMQSMARRVEEVGVKRSDFEVRQD